MKMNVPVELLDELVLEILIRLPVKSLLRFKLVSKAWRAIISDPLFIRKHLEHSALKWKRNPSVLIAPHVLDSIIKGEDWPTTFSTQICFYQWLPGSATEARLMYNQDFAASSVRYATSPTATAWCFYPPTPMFTFSIRPRETH